LARQLTIAEQPRCWIPCCFIATRRMRVWSNGMGRDLRHISAGAVRL